MKTSLTAWNPNLVYADVAPCKYSTLFVPLNGLLLVLYRTNHKEQMYL